MTYVFGGCYTTYHLYNPDEVYILSALSLSHFTPLTYVPPEFTPSASMGFMDFFSHETIYTPHGVNAISLQGIDLNEYFLFIANPEDNAADIRRNPHCRARDRRHGCILSSNSPHD